MTAIVDDHGAIAAALAKLKGEAPPVETSDEWQFDSFRQVWWRNDPETGLKHYTSVDPAHG